MVVDAGGPVFFQLLEQRGIAYRGQLEDFGHAVEQVAARLGGQKAAVEQHGQRRLEAAQAVYAAVEADAVLDAQGGIDVAHERGGHLDVRNAAPVGGGQKADHVGQHAATDGNDGLGAAVDGEFIQPAGQVEPGLRVLARLAGRAFHNARVQVVVAKPGADSVTVEGEHVGVHHHKAAACVGPAVAQQLRAVGRKQVGRFDDIPAHEIGR